MIEVSNFVLRYALSHFELKLNNFEPTLKFRLFESETRWANIHLSERPLNAFSISSQFFLVWSQKKITEKEMDKPAFKPKPILEVKAFKSSGGLNSSKSFATLFVFDISTNPVLT